MQDLVLDLADIDYPHRDASLPRREGNDRNAGELPRDLRRRSRRRCASSTSSSPRRSVSRLLYPSRARRTRASSTRRCSARSPASRRARRSSRRPSRAAVGRRDRGAVRGGAGRLVGDGVQAQSDALRAHHVARALRAQRSSRTPIRRTACSSSSARSTTARIAASCIPESVPRDRRDSRPDGERRRADSRCIRRAFAAVSPTSCRSWRPKS